ncbi:MAG TPA: hypothetical protein VFA03_08010 [Acetobacteraceae bacterium]|nr:hypothetical protein [Acetobacteraceae bacterium]
MAAVLTVRELPEEVPAALCRRAAETGHSVEAEARDILIIKACTPRMVDEWWGRLAERRRTSTASPLAVESADLIRDSRLRDVAFR